MDDNTSRFPDQPIDIVLIELTVANSSSSLTFQGLRNNTPTETAISFTFTCDTDYYGSFCSVYCLAQDEASGHYTCDPVTGTIICNDGFIGTNCEIQQVHFRALTEYCREEFEKFTTFLTRKKCRNWSVFGYNWPIFRVKKVVLVFCYDRYTSAVIG